MLLKNRIFLLTLLLFCLLSSSNAQFDFKVNGETYTCPKENYEFLGSPFLRHLDPSFRLVAISEDWNHYIIALPRKQEATYRGAHRDCSTLNVSGVDDWYLPKRKHFEILKDHTRILNDDIYANNAFRPQLWIAGWEDRSGNDGFNVFDTHSRNFTVQDGTPNSNVQLLYYCFYGR